MLMHGLANIVIMVEHPEHEEPKFFIKTQAGPNYFCNVTVVHVVNELLCDPYASIKRLKTHFLSAWFLASYSGPL